MITWRWSWPETRTITRATSQKAGTQAPQRITCGGGGAFLNATHQLPDPPKPINVGGTRQHYELAAVYPDKNLRATA